jgi:hypothetical protein
MAGNWRKVPNEELHDLYCSTNITRVSKLKYSEMDLVGKYEVKRQFAILRHKWEVNPKVGVK